MRRATHQQQPLRRLHNISIHALREEGDDEGGVYTITLEAFLSTPSARRATPKIIYEHGKIRFLSTPSARRATGYFDLIEVEEDISIHALREEDDSNPRKS